MKNVLLAFLIISSSIAFAQEGMSMKGNTMTIKEVAPIWPGCEGTVAQKKNCFNQNLGKHISKNFKFPKGYEQGMIKEKVIVSFNINTKGLPEIKSVTGGTKELREEARRNIMLLPQMAPGQAGGTPVAIGYKVPFTF